MYSILLITKSGEIKEVAVEEIKEENLYKLCGYKSSKGFARYTTSEPSSTWKVKYGGIRYFFDLYAKETGKEENKYEFPPPVDQRLFFGTCAIVARRGDHRHTAEYASLSIPIWNACYEKLFGGFEELKVSEIEDEKEVDELAGIPSHLKTKEGYLKDGFVVDDDEVAEKPKKKAIKKKEKKEKKEKKTQLPFFYFLDENEAELTEEEFV
jgi:hypothetical protein